MDNNKTPQALDCSYTNLCCFSPDISFTDFGGGVSWAGTKLAVTPTTFDVPMYPQYLNSVQLFINQRNEESLWACDYSDDIFQTLRETELRRYALGFQSEQCGFRSTMLRLLKVATEMHKLARTTLHLALYLLDGFMDNYTIRTEKLNLTALTCLIIAAKIEEAVINAPKFVDLNKLVGDVYTLDDFRKAEMRILMLFHFDLIRPTAATFAEFFANNIITLDDFHIYLRNWHGGILNETTPEIVPPLYRTYEEMATALSKLLFTLIDETLNYIKFVNARPSIIAASCIAVVRYFSFITPTWTSYLVKITECTQDMVEPCMEAIITLHNLQLSKVQAMLYGTAKLSNAGATLCDSPEYGFVSICDTKSKSSEDESSENESSENESSEDESSEDESSEDESSEDEIEHDEGEYSCSASPVSLGKRTHSASCSDESDEEQNITSCTSSEFSLIGKRRRIVGSGGGVM